MITWRDEQLTAELTAGENYAIVPHSRPVRVINFTVGPTDAHTPGQWFASRDGQHIEMSQSNTPNH